jgi:hypothetical protein
MLPAVKAADATIRSLVRPQSYRIAFAPHCALVPEKGSKRQVSKPEQPEPWLAPKYKSPRGTVQKVRIPKSKIVRPPSATDPGYVYVPQTGRTFQNLPSLPGSGPGGAETFQDRAIRCTHQAGLYGQVGADRGSYMGGCL